MPDVLERLRVLIDSSTPIVILETVEETRAVRLVHAAASPLNLAVFEWTIASGLVRCSNDAKPSAQRVTATPHGTTSFSADASAQAIYNSRDPSQALSNLDAAGLDVMAENLRGLTEEEADRAISHGIVNRRGLTSESVTDVLDAKKDLLRHSGSLEFIEASDKLAGVGGLDNLKQWLAQRPGFWEDLAPQFWPEPARGGVILGG